MKHKGFSLVELLVVIAIIGILAGVMMGTFSGGTESAKNARCLSNLRNLSAAVQSYGSSSGHYAPAGSLEWVNIVESNGNARRRYGEYPGWIAWNSQEAYKGSPTSTRANNSWNISMYSTDADARQYVITNGAVYAYMGGNHSAYVCPSHANKKQKLAGGKGPNWSYVMNAYFKYYYKGKSAVDSSDPGFIGYGYLKRADKRLLFAEISFCDVGGTSPETSSGDLCDSILQYKGCLGCGTPESIGFNHKSGKTYLAHVAFADGHVEKLTYPKAGMSSSEMQELTQWLCLGKDVSFDGKKYEDMTK